MYTTQEGGMLGRVYSQWQCTWGIPGSQGTGVPATVYAAGFSMECVDHEKELSLRPCENIINAEIFS